MAILSLCPIRAVCDYNKFDSNFLTMLKSKRARYYAKKDYAELDSKNSFGRECS